MRLMPRIVFYPLMLGILSFFLSFSTYTYLSTFPQVDTGFDKSIRASYKNMCEIFDESGKRAGSGFVLDSGYVITAAHVVDGNRNYTNDEYVYVSYSYYGAKFKAEVVLMGNYLLDKSRDVAVLKVDGGKIGTARLLTSEQFDNLPKGTSVVCTGIAREEARDVSIGIYTGTNDSEGTITNPVFFGYSGAGIFIKGTNQVIGIVTRLGFDSINERAIIDGITSDGKRFRGRILIDRIVVMPNVTQFVTSNSIREFILENDLDEALIPIIKIGNPINPYLIALCFLVITSIAFMVIFYEATNKKMFRLRRTYVFD